MVFLSIYTRQLVPFRSSRSIQILISQATLVKITEDLLTLVSKHLFWRNLVVASMTLLVSLATPLLLSREDLVTQIELSTTTSAR